MTGNAELNAWLAEHLLGWTRLDESSSLPVVWVHPLPTCTMGMLGDSGYCAHTTHPQAYMLDLSGSWEGMGMVLEAVKARGFFPELWVTALRELNGRWYAQVGNELQIRYADTASMAVALAAQAALQHVSAAETSPEEEV